MMYIENTDGISLSDVKTVLLIEDDHMISMLTKVTLDREGFNVKQCFRGDLALQDLNKYQPDMVVLDIGLPGLDGFHICHKMREIFSGPLVILTAQGKEQEQIMALGLGADDYLIKPISPNLLKARIHALFRRQPLQNNLQVPNVFQVGDVELHPQANKCHVRGKGIRLSRFEFQLLALLLRNVGRVMTRDSIYNILLGREYNGTERTVDVRISRLREKLLTEGMQQTMIETVWGKGYILNEKAA